MTNTKDGVNERAMLIYKHEKSLRNVKSKTDFADKMDYSRTYVSEVLNGKVPLTDEFADRLADRCGIDKAWLLKGVGEMRPTPTTTSPPPGSIKYMRENMLHITREQMATEIGLSVQAVEELEEGRRMPTSYELDLIKAKFNANNYSLTVGDGGLKTGTGADYKDKYIASLEKNQVLIEKLAESTLDRLDKVEANLSDVQHRLSDDHAILEGIQEFCIERFARIEKRTQEETAASLGTKISNAFRRMQDKKTVQHT